MHAYNVGTVQGDPVVMIWLNALKSKLVQLTKVQTGWSGPLGEVAVRDLVSK